MTGKRKHETRQWFHEWKKGFKCLKCEEDHPSCIEFHHRDPDKKDFNISHAVRMGWGKNRISQEVLKCDILCSNCHKKEHWNLSLNS